MMKSIAIATASLAMLAAPALHAQETPVSKGEAKLAKLIEGRIAGEPESCITMIGSRPMTKIDDTALVYRAGNTVWVNRTRTPEAIDDNDYLVIRKFGTSQLCKSDNVTTYDRSGNFFSGVIFLDDFVPYREPDAEG